MNFLHASQNSPCPRRWEPVTGPAQQQTVLARSVVLQFSHPGRTRWAWSIEGPLRSGGRGPNHAKENITKASAMTSRLLCVVSCLCYFFCIFPVGVQYQMRIVKLMRCSVADRQLQRAVNQRRGV